MFPHIWHRYIFLFGLIGLAAGMMFGTVPTSIPQIILAANWLLEKNYSWKWQQLKHNKLFWVLASLFILHLVGMMYTENMSKGLDDLRNKLPLLSLPIVLFSSKPLTVKEFKLLFFFFLLSVIASSVCCFLVYEGYTKKVIVDVRQASVFMSHIRFSLFIAFSIISLVYFVVKEERSVFRAYSITAIVWLLFVMYKLEMATGFVCLVLSGSLLLFYILIKKLPKLVSFPLVALGLCAFAYVAYLALDSLKMFDKDPNSPHNVLLEKTMNQRVYLNDTVYGLAENGNLIGVNINYEELEKEWNKKSSSPYMGKDKKGNDLRYTLLRYMSSKGYTKDSVGVSLLHPEDIANIELGLSNYRYTSQDGLFSRWRELVWEYTKYQRGENPSGHTLTMRLEFWKTACYIIKQHQWFGVGTGDVQDAFNRAYEETGSRLDKEWRLRCHNQYLAIGVAFGGVGLFCFLFYLLYPAISVRSSLHNLYWPFFIIALLSFITEDTLETQSGVTFFIFFQSLFLWLASFKNIQKEKQHSN